MGSLSGGRLVAGLLVLGFRVQVVDVHDPHRQAGDLVLLRALGVVVEEFGGVSKATVRAAMAQLRSEGLVETRHGLGTFVRESKELIRWVGSRYRVGEGSPNIAEEEAGGYKQEVTAERSIIQASSEVAARLWIEAGDVASQVIYRWYVDGEPVQVSMQWEPLALTKGTPIETADIISRADRFVIQVRQEVKRP
jgi:DNA-binding GntR family transcriptional regulator